MGNVRVLWQCDLCAQSGHVDVRGKLEWRAVMDMVANVFSEITA